MGSSIFSQDKTNYDGSKFTSIKFADGTAVTITRPADGKCIGGVSRPTATVSCPTTSSPTQR